MKKIYGELSRIQRELKAPKNLFNKFGNYKYRNAEGILESVKPLLGDLALIINDEPIAIGERYYIKATVTLTDGEESVSAVAYAREDETKKGMDGCQITGACSSYARKYALNALLMIDDSKDSDDDALSPKNPANIEKREEKFENYADPDALKTVPQATENAISKAFATGMNTFMQMFEITDSQEALARFNSFRKSLHNAGIIQNTGKMKSAEEVVDTFDAIYKNFRPGDKK